MKRPKCLTFYPLEYYQNMFTKERWQEILQVLDHWVHPILNDGKELKSLHMNPETRLCFNDNNTEVADHTKDYWKKQVLEKYITDEEFELCNALAFEKYRLQQDQRRYDAAVKIDAKDWYDEPIFGEDNFYHSIDEMKELLEGYDDEPPKWVYGSKEVLTLNKLDICHAVDNLYEKIDVEDREYDAPEIPPYLQEAWDRFCDENAEKYYEIDYKTVILL